MQKQNISDISVIICVYTEERWDDIKNAIESLRQQVLRPREIILSVDHNPGLYARICNEIHDVIAVDNVHPRGLSGARNSGLEVAQGTLVAFLDDDATAAPDWLFHLKACFVDDHVLGVGGNVEPAWQTARPDWFPGEFYWVVGCTYQQIPSHPIKVRNPYGGCTCYRYELFTQNGGFRDTIGRMGSRPLGCEETELCIRAQQRWPERYFLYEPRARIHHHIPAKRARWSYFMARCYAEGLSKAMVTSFVGHKDGLAAERAYTFRTLPLAIIKGVDDTLRHHQPSGVLRAGTIVAGLAITAAGFARGCIAQYQTARFRMQPSTIASPSAPHIARNSAKIRRVHKRQSLIPGQVITYGRLTRELAEEEAELH
jgi:Glycosyltransferases, probably involved in cell wall biogenesis